MLLISNLWVFRFFRILCFLKGTKIFLMMNFRIGLNFIFMVFQWDFFSWVTSSAILQNIEMIWQWNIDFWKIDSYFLSFFCVCFNFFTLFCKSKKVKEWDLLSKTINSEFEYIWYNIVDFEKLLSQFFSFLYRERTNVRNENKTQQYVYIWKNFKCVQKCMFDNGIHIVP